MRWTRIIAALGLVGILAFSPNAEFVTSAHGSGSSGQIKTSDYGTTPISGGAYCWRGYAVKIAQDTVVSGMIGGGTRSYQAGVDEFHGAIYDANLNGDGRPLSPKSVLVEVRFPGNQVDQEVLFTGGQTLVSAGLDANQKLPLEAGKWYYFIQGRNTGSVLHWYVANLNVDDLLSASARIDEWLPNSGDASGQAYIGSCGGRASSNIGQALNTTDAKPALGIIYDTTVSSLPVVETQAEPLQAVLSSTGGGATALYMEYGTAIENDPDVLPACNTSTPNDLGEYPGCKIRAAGLNLNLAEAGYTGETPYSYGSTVAGLPASTRYFYRARAINDAGRVDGAIRSFTTPSAPGKPTLDSVTPGDGSLQLFITPVAGNPGVVGETTNFQYRVQLFSDTPWASSSAGWQSRSPASAESPLVITGLTNGTKYRVQVRAVASGVPGAMSDDQLDGTPIALRVPSAPTISTLDPSTNSITVSFAAPNDDGGSAVLNYEYSTDGNNYTPLNPASTSSPFTITGLDPAETYSVTIKAINGVGSGDASSASSVSTSSLPPPPAGNGGSGPTVAPQPAVNPPAVTPRVIPQLPATPPTQQGPVLRGNVPPAPPSAPVATIGGRSTPIQTQVTSPTGFSLTAGVLNLGLQVQGDQGVVRQNSTGGTEVEVRTGSTTALTGSGLLPRSTVQVFLPLQGSNAKEVARIPVDENGAFSGDAVFATRVNERPMPIGRQVMQIVSLDEDGQQSVVEMTINIAQGSPAPEFDRTVGELPTLTPGQSIATNAGEPEIVRVTADSAVKSATVDGDGWTMSVNIQGARGEVSESTEGGALLQFVRDEGIVVTGGGFMPGTRADVWLFSDPTLLGTVDIDANGEFSGTVMVDGNVVPVGNHTLQLQGVGDDGYVRSANLGVSVSDAVPQATTEEAAGGLLWWLVGLIAVVGLAAALTFWRVRSRGI